MLKEKKMQRRKKMSNKALHRIEHKLETLKQDVYDLTRAVKNHSIDIKSVTEMALFNNKAVTKLGIDDDKALEITEELDKHRKGIELYKKHRNLRSAVFTAIMRSEEIRVVDTCVHSQDTMIVCPNAYPDEEQNHVRVKLELLDEREENE